MTHLELAHRLAAERPGRPVPGIDRDTHRRLQVEAIVHGLLAGYIRPVTRG